MSTIQDFSGYSPTWCPGCGNWGIGVSVKKALSEMGVSPSGVFVVFGIGCSGNMNDFLNAYAIHSLHGRSVPTAIGMKVANHNKPVIAIVGDGDCYGEGGNHFIHACRGNHDITVLVHDNMVYGLTTGQVAPTAQKGSKGKSTPAGTSEESLNVLTLAVASGATFVAQAFAGDSVHLSETIKQAVSHKGFSLVNVLQPCVTFNKKNTYEYYKQRVYHLKQDYDPADWEKAMLLSSQPAREEKFPLGIIYKALDPTYTDSLPQLKESALVDRQPNRAIDSVLSNFC